MNAEPARPLELRTGMAQSLMHEISQRLNALVESGEVSAIDLRSLPMTPADRVELEERLGRGDVEAVLDVAGPSEVWETRFAGVWWIRHFGADDKVAAEQIEITTCPQILSAHRADIAAASVRLREDLVQAEATKGAEDA